MSCQGEHCMTQHRNRGCRGNRNREAAAKAENARLKAIVSQKTQYESQLEGLRAENKRLAARLATLEDMLEEKKC